MLAPGELRGARSNSGNSCCYTGQLAVRLSVAPSPRSFPEIPDEPKKNGRSGASGRGTIAFYVDREPPVGIEPTTARLRIECSTAELRWPWNALARTRTATPFGTTPSRWRVYQFHHQGVVTAGIGGSGDRGTIGNFERAPDPSTPRSLETGPTGLTGLEPATSGVTDRHSNQAELQPQLLHVTLIAPTGVEPVSAP